MKKLIVAMIMIVSGYANAGFMAEIKVSGNPSYEKTLIDLFAKEAKTPHSPINDYMTALKSNPENQDYDIEDTISDMDIVRLESGGSGGFFEVNYLIFIRAGYKSNFFQVGFLKAQAIASEDETQPTSIRITEPAKVIIE